MAADGGCHRFAVMARAAEVNGHAQQSARPRDPIRALAQAVVALRLGQLALLSQLADLAHDRRLMQADFSEDGEADRWPCQPRPGRGPASWTPGTEAAAASGRHGVHARPRARRPGSARRGCRE